MNIACNRPNLKKHAKALLGNEWTEETEAQLIKECLTGFVREPGHISHSQSNHLERVDKILGTCGVEGMLLGADGEDVSGTCDPSQVEWDIHYCNTGDSYALTVMYVNGSLRIGDWGSIVESIETTNA